MSDATIEVPPRDAFSAVTLTEEELAVIGRIVIGWGSAESSLGSALAQLYGLSGVAARELLLKHQFQRKLGLLTSIIAQIEVAQEVKLWATELSWVFESFKASRDVIMHGFPVFDAEAMAKGEDWERGIRMPSHDRFLAAADLPRQLLAAEYASSIAAAVSVGAMMQKTLHGRDTLGRGFYVRPRPTGL